MTMFVNAQENETAGNTVGDTGKVHFTYQNETVSYTTVRAADGYEWLQQNLGSSAVATAINDANAYGDYFQWGRWDDGHQLKDSETSTDYPTPNNPIGLGEGTNLFYIGGGSPWGANYEGWFANPEQNDTWEAKNLSEVTANNGMDPCKAIGENWEIPSEADYDNVFQKENIFPSPDGTSNGITRAFNSNLKFAGAGARKDDSWSFVDTRAYLWTKTASENPNFYRYVYLGTYAGSSTGFGGDTKSHGYNVRCVNKSTNLSTNDQIKSNDIKVVIDGNDLRIVSKENIKSVQIFAVSGQKVASSTKNITNISNLKSGVYIVLTETVDGNNFSTKIVKK